MPVSAPQFPLRSRHQGFTLIELLMVIAIIGILSAITFGITRGVQNAQARAKAKSELALISQALDQFKSRHGDYPWTTRPASDAEENSEQLLQALTGWMKFEPDVSGQVKFDDIDPSEQPANGPERLIEVGKLTLREIGSDEDFVEFPESDGVAPSGYYIVDPWGEPYVYVYGQSGDASNTWDVFGYHLYSKGPDQAHNDSVIEAGTGVMDNDFRESGDGSNLDNIYSGE